MMMMVRVMMTMACRHIPTMTKSHHGGEMSVMIKVGMCQIPTIYDKLQLQQLANWLFNPFPVLRHKTQIIVTVPIIIIAIVAVIMNTHEHAFSMCA